MDSLNHWTVFVPKGREIKTPPLPETLTGTQATAATGAKNLDISTTAGYLYKIKGLEIIAGANQTIGDVTLLDGASVVKGTINTSRTVAGASVRWTKDRQVRGRQFSMNFHRSAAGIGVPEIIMDDLEFPMAVTLKRAYFTSGTATGAVLFTVDIINSGVTTQILTNASVGLDDMENEALNLTIPANTDTTIQLNDAGVATDDVNLILWFEINEEEIDFPAEEYIPITLHRGQAVGVATINMMDDLEVTENLVVRRCYANCGTGPGANNLDVILNGVTMFTINGAVIGENEALNLPLIADVDNTVQLTDAGGLADDITVTLWCQRTTPVAQENVPNDVEDRYGDVFIPGGHTVRIAYTEGVASETITARLFCQKVELI
jgi:hypothetical protein